MTPERKTTEPPRFEDLIENDKYSKTDQNICVTENSIKSRRTGLSPVLSHWVSRRKHGSKIEKHVRFKSWKVGPSTQVKRLAVTKKKRETRFPRRKPIRPCRSRSSSLDHVWTIISGSRYSGWFWKLKAKRTDVDSWRAFGSVYPPKRSSLRLLGVFWGRENSLNPFHNNNNPLFFFFQLWNSLPFPLPSPLPLFFIFAFLGRRERVGVVSWSKV